jgi:hypothetical protein
MSLLSLRNEVTSPAVKPFDGSEVIVEVEVCDGKMVRLVGAHVDHNETVLISVTEVLRAGCCGAVLNYFREVGKSQHGTQLDSNSGIMPLSRLLDGGETAYRLDAAIQECGYPPRFSEALWKSYVG